jgi:hypothetical protein
MTYCKFKKIKYVQYLNIFKKKLEIWIADQISKLVNHN